jgi:MEMO1 family protein
LNLDGDRLLQYLRNGKTELCGGAGAVAVIKAAVERGANRVKILKYGDSGDITGDKSSVVGYVAAVLYKESDTKDKKPAIKSMTVSNDNDLAAKFNLDEQSKKKLLQIARKSLTSYIKDNKIPEFDVPENLQELGAAFVTLEENGMLRGCIGHTTAVEPLYKTVSVCAVQAAVSDPRFPPVRADEIDRLHIEISVLTPMEKIGSFDEIKVGRDGLMIFKGNQRGLLLPQVATEYGWTATEFLEQTCVKAGLDRQAYKSPDAVVYRFQAVIFGE